MLSCNKVHSAVPAGMQGGVVETQVDKRRHPVRDQVEVKAGMQGLADTTVMPAVAAAADLQPLV